MVFMSLLLINIWHFPPPLCMEDHIRMQKYRVISFKAIKWMVNKILYFDHDLMIFDQSSNTYMQTFARPTESQRFNFSPMGSTLRSHPILLFGQQFLHQGNTCSFLRARLFNMYVNPIHRLHFSLYGGELLSLSHIENGYPQNLGKMAPFRHVW